MDANHKKLKYYLESLHIHEIVALNFAIEAGRVLEECEDAEANSPEFQKVLEEYKINPRKLIQLLDLNKYRKQITSQLSKIDSNIDNATSIANLCKSIAKGRMEKLSKTRLDQDERRGINRGINLN